MVTSMLVTDVRVTNITVPVTLFRPNGSGLNKLTQRRSSKVYIANPLENKLELIRIFRQHYRAGT